MGPLAAGESSTGSTTFVVPARGVYYIIAFADVGNAVPEPNEDNVRVSDPFVVYGGAGADLMGVSVSASATATAGSTLSVTDTVANVGGQPTYSNFYVRYFLSPTASYEAATAIQIDERYTGTLAASQTSPSTRAPRLATNLAGGIYWIVAMVDPYNHVAEVAPGGEGNNVLVGNQVAVGP